MIDRKRLRQRVLPEPLQLDWGTATTRLVAEAARSCLRHEAGPLACPAAPRRCASWPSSPTRPSSPASSCTGPGDSDRDAPSDWGEFVYLAPYERIARQMTWSEALSAKRNLGDELIEALYQARDLEHGKGRGATRVYPVPRTARESAVPPAPAYSHRRVSRLRSRLALSQPIFAAALNVSPETVRDWEQGKRQPDGAALRLLELTEQRPDLLLSLVCEKVRKPTAASIIRAARDGGSSSS